MWLPQNNNKLLWMFLVLISFFIFIFFSKWLYSEYINNRDSHTEKLTKYSGLVKKLDKFNSQANLLQKNSYKEGDIFDVTRYMWGINEHILLNKLYGFSTNYSKNGQMKILWMTLTQGNENELGFLEADVNLTLRVSNEQVVIDFLDFLIKNKSHTFFISTISIPKTNWEAFNINIPLTIFYTETLLTK